MDSKLSIAPKPGSVRVAPLSAIPELLRTYSGNSTEAVLARAGLRPDIFDNPENSLSFATAGELLELCASDTGIPHFGLMVGINARPESLGELAKLAVTAPTVRAALCSMIQHICVNDRGGVATLYSNDNVAKLGYAVYVPMHRGIGQVNDLSLAVMCNLLRSFYGENWSPSELLFCHSEPDDTTPYESFFRAPLRFEADEYAHVFPSQLLKQQIPGGSEQLLRETLEEISWIETILDVEIVERVRSVMHPLLVSQCCTHDFLAQTLSMHPRTLDRRLKENDLTFRELMNETRYSIAMQMLAYSEISLLRISTLLGYADASVFSRSFRKWSGLTPSEWREHYQTMAPFRYRNQM